MWNWKYFFTDEEAQQMRSDGVSIRNDTRSNRELTKVWEQRESWDEDDDCQWNDQVTSSETNLVIDEPPAYSGEAIQQILSHGHVRKEVIIVDKLKSEAFGKSSNDNNRDRDAEKSNPSLEYIDDICAWWGLTPPGRTISSWPPAEASHSLLCGQNCLDLPWQSLVWRSLGLRWDPSPRRWSQASRTCWGHCQELLQRKQKLILIRTRLFRLSSQNTNKYLE